MNYGLNLAASGMLTSMYTLDVASNNLANVDTIGFKVDKPIITQRATARNEDGLYTLPTNMLLERLGGGVHLAPTVTDFSQGSFRTTNAPLDVAIEGKGFFVLDAGEGQGDQRLRFTRDGRLAVDAGGRLVHAGTGLAVLDDRGRPIRLDPNLPAAITPGGEVRQDGRAIARLQVTDIRNRDALQKMGDSLVGAVDNRPLDRVDADATIHSGMLENSGVNAISAMMAVRRASSGAQGNARMIGYMDTLMDQAINRFARIG
jgi:flagellar basal-body rod protein FlgG